MTTARYQVSGMTCEHCVRAVEAEVAGLVGVTGVAVDLRPGGVSTVTVTSTEPVPPGMIAEALGEAGDYQLVTP